MRADLGAGWYDQGDNSGPRYQPGDGSFYTQPGRYLLTWNGADGRVLTEIVTVSGAPAFTTNNKRAVLDTNQLRRMGFSGSDNGVGCARGADGYRLYFFAHADSDDGWQTWESRIVRLHVANGHALKTGAVHVTKVQGSPFRSPNYLDAGPVIRYGSRLWMLALSGLAVLPDGTHGGIELLWSDDEGLTWIYAGNAITQPFTLTQHQAIRNDAANMGVGAMLVANADGDGRDYLYCYFHQAEADGSFNSLATARADVRALTAAASSLSIAPLWKKRLNGIFSGAHDGPADELLRCGGWPSVVWCALLDCYLLLTAAPPGTGKSLFYLSSSQDGLAWSNPALVYAETRPGWYASVPCFDAPDGYVGLEFDIMIGPCWNGGPTGVPVITSHEIHGVHVTLVQ